MANVGKSKRADGSEPGGDLSIGNNRLLAVGSEQRCSLFRYHNDCYSLPVCHCQSTKLSTAPPLMHPH